MGNDETKRMILARRARFVAAALASVAATTTGVVLGVEACGGDTTPTDSHPEPCLGITCDKAEGCSNPPNTHDAASDAPEAAAASDAMKDSATDVLDAKKDVADAEPLPCLAPPLQDQ